MVCMYVHTFYSTVNIFFLDEHLMTLSIFLMQTNLHKKIFFSKLHIHTDTTIIYIPSFYGWFPYIIFYFYSVTALHYFFMQM